MQACDFCTIHILWNMSLKTLVETLQEFILLSFRFQASHTATIFSAPDTAPPKTKQVFGAYGEEKG